MSDAIRVLVVDDQEIVRAGLRMVLAARPEVEVVGECDDGADVVQAVADTSPDVILMDVRMPGLDGIDATRRVRDGFGSHSDGGPGVLVLTTFDLDEHVFAALRAGAEGFLVKNSPTDDLVAAIGDVHRGDAVVGPRITRRLIEHFVDAPVGPAPVESAALASLTPREREVLELVAGGLSNAEIAARLTLSEVTVKTHVGRVLTKLGLRDRTQAVVYAYENGVVRPGHDGG